MKLIAVNDLLNRILNTIFDMYIKCEVYTNKRQIHNKTHTHTHTIKCECLWGKIEFKDDWSLRSNLTTSEGPSAGQERLSEGSSVEAAA